ncbi:Uncharacterised protein [Moraxella lacunata]|uniref:Uncharacterized protein n=1 Tax=Moraxella lacunata TaxID=477 RepID=A0A378TPK4_MORLA|nr:hypothetical protein [Moraxella lacunata]STZ62758.1 Uncharacterised protein [Moraxella lacunata]
MPHHTNTIADWLISNRLYEDNLFYYALIICFWFFWGFAFLGFELEGFSLQQNLFFNFIYYLFICTMMALCPVWFRLFFGKTHTAKREQELHAHLDELDDEDRQEVVAYLNETGQLAMRPIQRWALVFLGSYFLFEVFFISAWVKDLALVWEPRWASALIEWAISHTNVPPLNVDRDIFVLDVLDDGINELGYKDDYFFMNSDFGHAVMLYRVIKTFTLPFVMSSLIVILWKPIDWLGFYRADPRHIDGVSSFLYSVFLSFGAFLLFIGATLAFVSDVELVVHYIFGKFNWLSLFWQHIGLIFILFYFKFLFGWFVFIKQSIFSIFGLGAKYEQC